MFHAIANLVTKRPKLVVITLLLFMAIAGAVGGGVVSRLTAGGFEDPGAPSKIAADQLVQKFNLQPSNLILLVTPKDGSVDSPQSVQAAGELEKKLKATEGVSNVTSYWSTGRQSALKSKTSNSAMIIATIDGSEDQVATRTKIIAPAFTISNDKLTVGVGGVAEINRQYTNQIQKDLTLAEMVAFPITLLLLIVVFRSLVAATLPLLIGGFALMGTFLVLYLLTLVTDVSLYALNLASMMSLGLAIDYSLFMVSRFREQLAKGDSTEAAVRQSVLKAGKTVTFSAITVAFCLAALMVFPQTFLRSFAYAGIAVAIVALIGAVFLLPALLMLLGKNVNALAISKGATIQHDSKLWHSVATFVMRRPVLVVSVVMTFLIILALPFLRINAGRSDERALPANNSARQVHAVLRSDYDSKETGALSVVATGTNATNPSTISTYAIALSKLPSVSHVESGTGIYQNGVKVAPAQPNPYIKPGTGSWLNVVPNVDALSQQGETLVRDIRAVPVPFEVKVGGFGATLVDLKASLKARMGWALLIIAVSMFVLFFLAFGSVFLPFKALVTALFSLSASFGALVWIFQDGHWSGILNFTATGMVDATMPILMFCIAFGLSMDYEMFLLSRIKEEHDKGQDNISAVAHGLEKTGGIVTAAAISISVIFIAFATSGVMIIKMLGLGLAIAVLLDAFVIRATLVPAFMRLAGNLNWWAPEPLARLYRRFNISE